MPPEPYARLFAHLDRADGRALEIAFARGVAAARTPAALPSSPRA